MHQNFEDILIISKKMKVRWCPSIIQDHV
jgi:hypothetical protein